MGIYSISGTSINFCHSNDGNKIRTAYDISGKQVFSEAESYLRVMTFNVQEFSGRNSNQTMLTNIINNYNPDIIGLQEIGSSSMPSLGATVFQDYPYQFIGNESNPAGIVSKIALDDPSFTAYVSKATETRGYEKAYITLNGTRIALFNTHIEVKGGAPHVLQTKEFFDALEQEQYFIALGDFNVECHDTLDPEYTDVVKQFIDAGYNLANWTTETGFVDTWFNGATVAGSTWVCPCDNIITSPNISIDSITYDKIKLGYSSGKIDHIAVAVALTIR